MHHTTGSTEATGSCCQEEEEEDKEEEEEEECSYIAFSFSLECVRCEHYVFISA